MAYQYGGLTLANVGDIVTQTSVSTNFEVVLRNSASGTAPVSPVVGQCWYDTTVPTMKQWNGTSWVGIAGVATFEDLTDVSVSTKVSMESGIMWDATAVQSGVTGQWVPNQIYDASPTGGASNDF